MVKFKNYCTSLSVENIISANHSCKAQDCPQLREHVQRQVGADQYFVLLNYEMSVFNSHQGQFVLIMHHQLPHLRVLCAGLEIISESRNLEVVPYFMMNETDI